MTMVVYSHLPVVVVVLLLIPRAVVEKGVRGHEEEKDGEKRSYPISESSDLLLSGFGFGSGSGCCCCCCCHPGDEPSFLLLGEKIPKVEGTGFWTEQLE